MPPSDVESDAGNMALPSDSPWGLEEMDVSMDLTSFAWPQAADDMDLLLHGLGNGSFELDGGPVFVANRITELDDEAVPSGLVAETSQQERGAEHPRAALGLVGPPGRDHIREPRALAIRPSVEETSSTSGESAWVITTPDSSENGSSVKQPSSSRRTSGEEASGVAAVTDPRLLGPCSKVWVVPKKARKKRRTANPNKPSRGGEKRPPRRRRPFQDEETRTQTALTRELRSCVRCRMLRIRCHPDMSDPDGPCLTCLALTVPIMCKLPCLRWIITDSSLYREQSRPYQLFSKRWQSMDLVDISTWASTEVKRIRLSQIYLDVPYDVEVREFEPVEGDMLEERWTSNGVTKSHRIPRYALADMERSAAVLQAFIQDNIARYICGTVGQSDELIWQTYFFAFRHAQTAKTPTERELVLNAFRFWVACRKTSNPEHIIGEDKLGGDRVDDPASVFHDRVPMPVIMIAQMECILYTRVLRPVHKKLLDQLNFLVKENKRQYWLTLYLTMFILLHSCAMVSRRDWETARQYNLQDEYANHESISKHQIGVNVMLAHFHYLNKGVLPFQLTYNAAGLRTLSKAADLDSEQVEFLKLTSRLLREPSRVAETGSVRARRDLNHDLYWVMQLYEENWVPGPTA
ncbi:hypothetical protein C8A01DRAFT_49768 [Parachaetomium inaequale]|uniref:Zn(2)-C6 fungal-type domain-containing protein n=1 Tax=Parachaetomium inaequale TaxID=2588326 RepID=A0AAN6SMB7_9PEZI|nr:hypothetical protein C8A01DRAFT_49768 [Parachaetomium inaequale]